MILIKIDRTSKLINIEELKLLYNISLATTEGCMFLLLQVTHVSHFIPDCDVF